jgi:rhamnosyltransferase
MPKLDSTVGRLAIVSVSFNPDLDVLGRQLAQLPAGSLKVVVDNASSPALREGLRSMAQGREDLVLAENPENLGLAAALNQGVDLVARHRHECEFVLLLDQDTETREGDVEMLLGVFEALRKDHSDLGAVGPRLVDESTGLEHGFHQIAGWRWTRRFPSDNVPLRIDNLNGSGLLMTVALYRQLGGMREDFFIDHVDTEWAFRLRAAGRTLYGVPGVSFRHRMGERGIRFWMFGWRVWPYRAPARHYYLFRNSMTLLRAPGVPSVWKAWAPVKLAATFMVHLLFDRARAAQARQMLRGIREGLR